MCGIQSIWVDIQFDDSIYSIGLYYNSPSSTEEERAHMIDEITLMCNKKQNCLVCGDFNFPAINWTTLQADKSSQKFLDCAQDCFLNQLVTDATRGPNILDLVLANQTVPITNIAVGCPLASSDHNIVTISLVVPKTKAPWKTLCLDYRRGDYKKFRRHLAKISWGQMEALSTVEDKWKFFKSVIQTGINLFIPRRKSCPKTKPLWYNQKVQKAIKKKRNKWDLYKKTMTSHNYATYKTALRMSNKTIQQEKRNLEERISANVKYDPKAFFKYAKQKMKLKEDVATITLDSGEQTRDTDVIAGAFNEFFASTFTKEDRSKLISISRNSPITQFEHRNVQVSEKHIERILSTLEPEKSQGPDNMHPRVLKSLSKHIAKPITNIFMTSISTGEVPHDWKLANVTPIHKKRV